MESTTAAQARARVAGLTRRAQVGWSALLLGGAGGAAAACGPAPGAGPEGVAGSRPIVEVVVTVQPGEAITRATAATDAFNALAETTRVRAAVVQAPADNKALAAKIIGGADDDLYFSESVGMDYKYQGLYKELDALVRPDKEVKAAGYVPGTWDVCRYREKLYGLPYGFGGTLMFLSKTLFGQLSVPLPPDTWTWAEFVDLARRLTRSTGERQTYGTWAQIHWPTFDVWLHRGGGGNWDARGTSLLDKPETLAGLQFLQDVFTKQGVVPLAEDGKFAPGDGRPEFMAQAVTGMWYIGPHARAWLVDPARNTARIEWDQAEMPVRQAGLKADVPSGVTMNAIWSTSKRPEAAYQFVRWLSLLPGQMLHLSTGGWPTLRQALSDPAFLRWEGKRNQFIAERVVAPGNRDFPGGVQFERWLGGDTADDPNATKLLEDLAYGRVSAKEFVDRAHPVARRLREKYESAR